MKIFDYSSARMVRWGLSKYNTHQEYNTFENYIGIELKVEQVVAQLCELFRSELVENAPDVTEDDIVTAFWGERDVTEDDIVTCFWGVRIASNN